jgi:hypothetical protein
MLAKPSLSSRPLRASLSSRSTIVFSIVAVVALGSTVATTGLGRGPEGRLTDARAKMNAECMDLADGNPCDLKTTPTPAIPAYKLGQQELAAADVALGMGDRTGAVTRLVALMERADRLDRAHTLIASVIAGKLIDGVKSRVDRDPKLLDDARLAASIRRTSYTSARHPLETERLHALAVLANVPREVPLRSAGLVESTATQAMTEVDGAYRAMQTALVANDVAGCEKAAQSATGLGGQIMVREDICRIALNVVQSGQHLDTLRARASAHGPRVHVTARRL